MLTTTLVVLGDQVHEAEDVITGPLSTGPVAAAQRQGLLATLLSLEDSAYRFAYVALTCYGVSLGGNGLVDLVDLMQPLTTLTSAEQVSLRELLVRRSWPAWARAPQHLRALLGRSEPPLLLADAARQLNIPLPTLANAAGRERLPTIRVGDRNLVYYETVIEAQERGQIHMQRGRPPRRSSNRGRHYTP